MSGHDPFRLKYRRSDEAWWDEPTITHADARAAWCPTCEAEPHNPCVTVTAPRLGKRMKLHHQARYDEARKLVKRGA